MDLAEIINSVASKLHPAQIFTLALFAIILAGIIYTLKIIFTRITEIMDSRAKVSEERTKALMNINERFDTYVKEHRHEHNQLENRLGHMQSEVAEMRRDSAAVRDSQIRVEAKLDVLLDNLDRRKNAKN